MSTNFYAVKVPTLQEHQEMQRVLKAKLYDDLQLKLARYNKSYHIGKRSCGWQFLFESRQSGAPWEEDTLQSIKEYLSGEGVVIENENGVKFTPEQFWNQEVEESLYHDPEKYINGEDYDRRDPSHTRYYKCEDDEFTNEEGIRFSKSEFS